MKRFYIWEDLALSLNHMYKHMEGVKEMVAENAIAKQARRKEFEENRSVGHSQLQSPTTDSQAATHTYMALVVESVSPN